MQKVQLEHLRTARLRRIGSFKWQKQTLTLDDGLRNRHFAADLYVPQTGTKTQNTLFITLEINLIFGNYFYKNNRRKLNTLKKLYLSFSI